MSALPNAAQINAKVAQIVRTCKEAFDMKHSTYYSGKRLGDAIAAIIAWGIIRQVDMGLEPDGYRLAPLNQKYLRWKILHGKNPALLHKDNEMMKFNEVRGLVVVSSNSMSMFYGIDWDCIEKASWTHEGKLATGSTQWLARPPRPFYDINKVTWDDIDCYLDNEMDSAIMSMGAVRK